MKVLVVVITEDSVMPECEQSIREQDYPNFNILIDVLKGELNTNRIVNIVNHRNIAREKALKTDADYFFLVDSDVILPKDAISNLIFQLQPPKFDERRWQGLKKMFPNQDIKPKQKHIMGGWYKIGEKDGKESWNCANWVADNMIASVEKPQNSVIRTDKIDLGCVMISRELFEKVEFKHGFDLGINKDKYACECLMFAKDAQDAGYELFMNGDVVCEHLTREVKV